MSAPQIAQIYTDEIEHDAQATHTWMIIVASFHVPI